MYVISISGLDGSGKSTQIKLLKEYLESRGKRVFYFHAVEFSVGNILNVIPEFFRRKNIRNLDSRLHGNDTEKCEDDNKPKSTTHANSFQIFLRKIALWIDIWRFKLLSKKLLNNGYDYILSDRFFYDSVVNIEYLSKSFPFRKGKVREEFERLKKNKSSSDYITFFKSPLIPLSQRGKLKIPSFIAIYLQTDPQNIMNRERVPDQGLEYLERKKKLYDAKTKIWNWKVIDGNRNKEEIFEEIKKATNRISG